MRVRFEKRFTKKLGVNRFPFFFFFTLDFSVNGNLLYFDQHFKIKKIPSIAENIFWKIFYNETNEA